MYAVEYSKNSLKALRKMPKDTALSIYDKVALLAVNPHKDNVKVKKLVGRDGYRLRIGDYRIIYILDDRIKVLSVINIGSRGGVYK